MPRRAGHSRSSGQLQAWRFTFRPSRWSAGLGPYIGGKGGGFDHENRRWSSDMRWIRRDSTGILSTLRSARPPAGERTAVEGEGVLSDLGGVRSVG
jgi:hypothetical protein